MPQIKAESKLQLANGDEVTGLNFADFAELRVKKFMEAQQRAARGASRLTTSKLRNIYGMIMNISTAINTVDDFDRNRTELQRLKVRLAYEAGRESAVKGFLNETGLQSALNSVETYDQFALYCGYAESLVAYFKFYGGKDR